MGWTVDVGALDQLAGRVAADAEGLRAQARRLGAHAASVRWVSSAGEGYRGQVARDVAVLQRDAETLDEAAVALRRLARSAGARLAAVQRAAADAVRYAEDTARGVAGEASRDVGAVVDDAGRVAGKVGGVLRDLPGWP